MVAHTYKPSSNNLKTNNLTNGNSPNSLKTSKGRFAGNSRPPSSYNSNTPCLQAKHDDNTPSDLAKGSATALHTNVLQSNTTNISYQTVPGKAGGSPYSIMMDNRPATQAIRRKDLFRFDTPHGYKGNTIGHHMNANPKLGTSNLQKNTLSALDHTEVPKPVYNAFKNFDDVAKVAKGAGKALGVAGAAMDVKELYDSYQEDGGKIGENTVTSAGGIAGGWGGAALGAKGGAMGGAALGTLICPGIGTAIGGFVGGLAGGILGGLGGRWAGEKVADAAYDEIVD